MPEKIFLNKFRVKEALEEKGKKITWLASKTFTRGRVGCDKASLYNYFRDGFERDTAESISKILGYTIRALSVFLGPKDKRKN